VRKSVRQCSLVNGPTTVPLFVRTVEVSTGVS
jgi:hypothetical protein